LNAIAFFPDSADIQEKISNPFEDPYTSLEFPSEEHSKTSASPDAQLKPHWEYPISFAEICIEDGEIIAATIEVDSFGDVKIRWFIRRIESMKCYGFGNIEYSESSKPNAP